MDEWKKIKLKEVLKEVNEKNKDEKVKRVLSVTNSRGFVSQDEYFEGAVHSANISNYKIIRKNQFAYNPSRVNVGSIDILKNYEEGALSPMYVVFEVDTTKLLPEYFKYYFQTNRFYENVKNNTQGSVRNSLNFKALADFDYLLPPIEEQEKIVGILKTIDSIIEKYESLLEEKKQFIKSQFVEMFGNEKYPKDEFINLSKEIYAGGDKPKDISRIKTEEYLYPVFANGYENEGLQGYSKNYRTKDESVTISARGTIGYSFIREGKFTPIVRLITITPNDRVNIIYLKYAIDNINIAGSGTSQAQLTVPNVKKQKIIVPPIELQNQFAEIVKQIDKQKIKLEKLIANYKTLKKGLMQRLLTGKVKVNV